MMPRPATTVVRLTPLKVFRAAFLVIVGLAAGAIGTYLYLKYENQFTTSMVKGLTGEALGARLLEEGDKAKLKSNALNGAILGATIAGLFGLAVGVVRGSLLGALFGAI